jgi:hypothetical protein
VGSTTARLPFLPWLFPNYFSPLPSSTIERVNAQLAVRDVKGTGEGVFLHAYAVVTACSERQQRLDVFRNQYGFARNMCFSFGCASVAILAAHKLNYHPVQLRWGIISALAAVTLFYRYLKFFRQFSYELLLRYAELTVPPA